MDAALPVDQATPHAHRNHKTPSSLQLRRLLLCIRCTQLLSAAFVQLKHYIIPWQPIFLARRNHWSGGDWITSLYTGCEIAPPFLPLRMLFRYRLKVEISAERIKGSVLCVHVQLSVTATATPECYERFSFASCLARPLAKLRLKFAKRITIAHLFFSS